jgi:Glycosyl transferase family 2
MTPSRPLVSCIMPTRDRRAFLPHAIRCFQRQDYRRSELVIVDDGWDPVGDLVPSDRRIRYVRLERRLVLGAKRNVACEVALGAVVVHWDDDDWMAPHRLTYQVGELERHEADICGTRRELFWDLERREAWLFELPRWPARRLAGNTLCYRRSLWERRPFHALAVGEDVRFMGSPKARNAHKLKEHRFCVALTHRMNTTRRNTRGPAWRPQPTAEIRRLMAGDFSFYETLGYELRA